MNSTKNIEELSYKEASQELELIIRNLESGDMELEQSLESYERGISLLKSLRERLVNAEQNVSVLVEGLDGSLEERPADAASQDTDLPF